MASGELPIGQTVPRSTGIVGGATRAAATHDLACDDEVELEAVRFIRDESPGAPPCRLSPILNGPDADDTNEPGRMESHRG